jgi:glycosyltransferase involved in cell wall biosynthesis
MSDSPNRISQSHSPLALSLIVPVFNERESLPHLHEKITAVMTALDLSWEIIYIDDGSSDGSVEVVRGLQVGDPHIVLAVQRRNFGKSQALAVGFALARGKTLITLDADLQDDPEEIPNLIAKLEEGFDVVSGWKHDRQDPLSKRLPSWVANTATSLTTGLKLHDMNSGLKAFRTDCVKRIQVYGDLHRYIPVIAHLSGYRVGEIPVTHHKRRFGRSKYGPGRFMRGGLDLITVIFLNQYSRRPLHLFGGGGVLMLLVGLGINFLLVIEWVRGTGLPLHQRPLLLLGILLMVMGIQLLTMGLLAELLVSYIQRQEDPLNTTEQVYKPTPAEQSATASEE